MTVRIPSGLRPVASAQPQRAPQKLTHAEVRETVVFFKADGPRGFGSQFAGWQGGAR